MPEQMAFLPLSDVSQSVKHIQWLLFFLLPEFIQPQMTVQISEAFVALVPCSVAIPGISSTCNGLLHIKVSRRYEFSRVLYQRLTFLQFLFWILPLFLFTSSFSSYRLYFSHEMRCFWCWNKEIIFFPCVTPYSERRVSTFRKTYSLRHFLSPFLFVSFVMSSCYLLFFTGSDRNIMALQKELIWVALLGLVRRLYARSVGLVV
jgi:hypothetical protein